MSPGQHDVDAPVVCPSGLVMARGVKRAAGGRRHAAPCQSVRREIQANGVGPRLSERHVVLRRSARTAPAVSTPPALRTREAVIRCALRANRTTSRQKRGLSSGGRPPAKRTMHPGRAGRRRKQHAERRNCVFGPSRRCLSQDAMAPTIGTLRLTSLRRSTRSSTTARSNGNRPPRSPRGRATSPCGPPRRRLVVRRPRRERA